MLRFNNTNSNLLTETQLIHEWVHHLEEKNHKIADLSRGKPSFPADKDALDAIKSHIKELEGKVALYGTNPLGEHEIKQKAATALKKEYNADFKTENIVFTPGGQFGLSLTFKLIQEKFPKGKIVMHCPWYLNHHELIDYNGDKNNILAVNSAAESNFNITADLISDSLKNNQYDIAAFLFCNPANPSGQVIQKSKWLKIAEILNQYPQSYIILDEAFSEVIFDYNFDCSLLHAYPEILKRTFLFRSGTKALGLPGERPAITHVPDDFINQFTYHQSRMLGNPAISTQKAMAQALSSINQEKKRNISRYYKANAEFLYNELVAILPKDKIIKPQGGFYLLAKFDDLSGRRIPKKAKKILETSQNEISNDVELAISLLFSLSDNSKEGVALIPGSSFGLKSSEMWMRVSFSPGESDIKKATNLLKNIVTPL